MSPILEVKKFGPKSPIYVDEVGILGLGVAHVLVQLLGL